MIDAFLRGLESIFAWLIEASWQASVLVALVLLLHLILRGRLNPRWHHALWLLVIARLLVPFLPESAFSVFQFAPSPPPVVTEAVTEPIFNALPMSMAGTPLLPAPRAAYPFSAFTFLALVWLAGALALLILTWQVNRRFARHVVAAPLVTNSRLLKLAETAQEELGLHRRLRIIESAQVQSPAIMGLFRPTLILPKDVRAHFEDDELRFIFLHEFAHLKRGDLFLQWLVALLQILHWFNPVLWYAFRRMRADREPATDALVLSCTGEAYKESYGQVLVKLLEHYQQRHSLPTLVGILEDKDQFKRRFSLIAKYTRGAYGWSLLGMVILGVLAIVSLTKKLAAATTGNDPLIDISSSELEFKIDPKETKQVEEFQAALRSPTEKGLNEALQKTHGFLLLGTGHDIQFRLSALTPPKDPNEHKIFRSSTQLHLGEDTVDSKINLHWIDAERVRINCLLELRDAKNVSLGLLSATWIQPIGKDGVLLLAKNGLTILAPQSDGSQIGCILRFVARANPKVGVSVLAASDQMSDVELLPSGSDDAGHVVTTDDEAAFYQALERDRTFQADSSVTSSTLAADAQMLLAIQNGDVTALRKVLEHAVDPHTFDPDRFHSNPVYWAVYFNRPEILKLLLKHFALGNSGPGRESPLQLAQKTHPDLLPIIQEGIKRNRGLLTAQLTAQLHSIHIDLPAFSGTPLSQVTQFLLEATSKVSYLDRRVGIGSMDLPPSTTFTSPARSNISIWDALQTIASANKLRFDVDGVDSGSITLYPPRDEAVVHPPAEKPEDPAPGPAKADAGTQEPGVDAIEMTLKPSTLDRSTARMTKNPYPNVQAAQPSKGSIEISFRLVEIAEDVYLTKKAKVDDAIEKADLGFFNSMQGVSLLTAPTVTTKMGLKAEVDIVREFPYPTEFELGKVVPHTMAPVQGGGTTNVTLVVPPTPREFATKDVGVTAEITPTINPADSPEPGKIVLNGKISVVQFEGFTKSNLGPQLPSFDTKETHFFEALDNNQQIGILIPGVRGDEQTITDKDKSGNTVSIKTEAANKRLILFVSVRRFL